MRGIMLVVASVVFAGMAAASAAAADGDLPNRLEKAKAGEWLLFRNVSGERDDRLTKYSIVEVKGEGDDKVVVLRIEHLGAEGEATESRDVEINMAKYRERRAGILDRAKQISSERLTIKDKEMPVTAVIIDSEDGKSEFKFWVSADLPVNGLVKTWSSDPEFHAIELIDYGF